MIQFSKVARLNLYAPVHKALRACMTDTLTLVGRIDAADSEDVANGIVRVRELLGFCREHLFIENQFVHPAMDARRPGSACETAGDHVRDEEAFERLEAELRAVEHSAAGDRQHALQHLYAELALFAAFNFQHMHVEETVNNSVLWETYTDSELLDLHKRIDGQVSLERKMAYLKWIVPNLPHRDRLAMLSAVKVALPQQAFEKVLQLIRPHVSDKVWFNLILALKPDTVVA
jgi:hypothetical protein